MGPLETPTWVQINNSSLARGDRVVAKISTGQLSEIHQKVILLKSLKTVLVIY